MFVVLMPPFGATGQDWDALEVLARETGCFGTGQPGVNGVARPFQGKVWAAVVSRMGWKLRPCRRISGGSTHHGWAELLPVGGLQMPQKGCLLTSPGIGYLRQLRIHMNERREEA